MELHQITIEKIEEPVTGFRTFAFREGHSISYQAGQYLTFVHHTIHGEIRRSYSIVSAPLLHEPLTIGVRRIENGAFSRWLIDHARPGDQLLTLGAAGFFTLPADISDHQRIFFLAAGSGITPVYSLLKTALYGHPHLKAVLVYSNVAPANTIFRDELLALQSSFGDRFQLELLFSNAPDLGHARLNRILLMELMDRYAGTERRQTLYYICGPESYMRMATYTLREAGVPAAHIRKENFVIGGPAPLRPLAPDRQTHTVELDYGGSRFRFDVNWPDSILQAARKAGIGLPYSCETGRCGSCAARCLDGKVWLSYNEVLTEEDLEKGLTLTCVGHPEGGNIRLII